MDAGLEALSDALWRDRDSDEIGAAPVTRESAAAALRSAQSMAALCEIRRQRLIASVESA